MAKLTKIDLENVPKHIAIIMDGNRRWARNQGLPEEKGHEAGAETLEKLIEPAAKMGIKTLTVYALSTENLKERAKRELFALFGILRQNFKSKVKTLMKKGVRVDVIGELEGLPGGIRKIVEEVRKTYIDNEAIRVNVALNYGGKKEMIEAIKNLVKEGIEIDKINDELISRHLYTKGQSDPELVIRTGGKIRLSNFLLWQTAYSELYFTTVLWPDFTPKELEKAVLWYQNQQRNFGK